MLSRNKTEYKGTSHGWQVVSLGELPRDLRRVLRVQFKEFVHWLDEAGPKDVTRTPSGSHSYADCEFERLYRLLADLRCRTRSSTLP